MISIQLAQTIFEKVHEAIPYPIIICGEGGEIYAASVKERVGNIHDGSKNILAGRISEMVITPEMQAEYMKQGRDVRNGIHIPIVVRGEKIATLGITGEPEAVRPYTNMTRLMLELVYEETLIRENIVKAHQEIDSSIAELAATSEELFASAELVATSNEAGNAIVQEVNGVLIEVKDNLSLIDEIARKTNLISINASIEAARSGVHGRAFAVVAQEIKKLSGETASYSSKITDLNDHFATRFQDILKIIGENNRASQTQKESIKTVADKAERIQNALSRLMYS